MLCLTQCFRQGQTERAQGLVKRVENVRRLIIIVTIIISLKN